jgi:hypothetical protein
MFHVPEKFRIVTGRQASNSAFGNNGAFRIPSLPKPGRSHANGQRELFIIASDGAGWEHVSVHVFIGGKEKFAMPFWDEMCYIKDLFWDEEDVVMQLHPKKSEYVNLHAYVLHLWRPTSQAIPTPPSILVGWKTAEPLQR